MINIGIIGFGRMGMVHADLIKGFKELKLIAICERNKQRIEEIKEKYDVEVLVNPDDLLENKNLDYIIISTSNESHETLTIKTLNKNKNVIVEKPLSLTYQGALKIYKTAEKTRKNVFTFQNRRWDEDFLKVREIIDSDILGEILQIQTKIMMYDANWAYWGIDGKNNPWRIKKNIGGMLLDWGPHLIDQIVLITKKDPIKVIGVLQNGMWGPDIEDYFLAILEYDNGLICQIEASSNGRLGSPRWYIIGTKGTLKVDFKSDFIFNEVELEITNQEGKKENQLIKLHNACVFSKGFYIDFVKYLNGKKSNFISLEDSVKVMKILDWIRESAKENKVIYNR